jgi:alpha-galactosidase
MVGAGSVGFTRALTKDILVPELVDTEFAFTDISKTNLEMVAALCKRDIKEYKLPAKIRTSTNRIAMLEGADHASCMIRQGGLGAFQTDTEHTTKVRSRTTRG